MVIPWKSTTYYTKLSTLSNTPHIFRVTGTVMGGLESSFGDFSFNLAFQVQLLISLLITSSSTTTMPIATSTTAICCVWVGRHSYSAVIWHYYHIKSATRISTKENSENHWCSACRIMQNLGASQKELGSPNGSRCFAAGRKATGARFTLAAAS